jgi:membrane associated rhomboid family serine protease
MAFAALAPWLGASLAVAGMALYIRYHRDFRRDDLIGLFWVALLAFIALRVVTGWSGA